MLTRVRGVIALLMVVASCACAAIAQAQVLYWLDTNHGAPTLNKADANGNLLQSVALPAGTQPEGLAVDAGGKAYWTEAAWANARVQRAAPTLASITTLVGGGSAFRGLAVDDVDHNLYWTSSNLITGAGILRAAFDGSGATVLIALGLNANPRGIAVDHAGGKLYWADFDQDAIYRANLNGSSVEVWQTLPSSSHPYGVAFDPVAQQVYWSEFAGKIRRSPTAGPPSTTLLGGLPNPTYLALDVAGGQMYWSEAGAGVQHIARGPMSGGSKTILPPAIATYGGLAFQPSASVSAPGPDRPTAFALAPLSPNPSRGDVQVEFAVPREARVRVSVLDLQGREVAVLANGVFPPGRHPASWSEGAQHAAPAGVYFVRLAADGRTWVRRLVRVR